MTINIPRDGVGVVQVLISQCELFVKENMHNQTSPVLFNLTLFKRFAEISYKKSVVFSVESSIGMITI